MENEKIDVQKMFDILDKFVGYDIICDYIQYGVEKREKLRLSSVFAYEDIFTNEGSYPFIGYGFAIKKICSIYGEEIYNNPYIDNNFDCFSEISREKIERLMFGDEYVDKRNKEIKEKIKKLNLD